jgi:hypothetical protein
LVLIALMLYRMNIHLAIAAALLAGCSAQAIEGEGAGSLEERLLERRELALGSTSDIAMRATGDGGEVMDFEAPSVNGGRVVVGVNADGLLLLEEVTVELSDFALEKESHGTPVRLELTDATLRLGAETVVEAVWHRDGDLASGVVTGDLLLDWALVGSDGDPKPLATQTIRNAELGLRVYLEPDGTIGATIDSVVPGRIWAFGAVEISDLTLALSGREAR